MHLDAAGLAHPAEVVAAEVDEHDVLGALLLVGAAGPSPAARPPPRSRRATGCRRSGAWSPSRRRRSPAPPGWSRRCRTRSPAARQPQQVHVRAGVGRPQHPVDVERVGRALGLEPLRDHHLERLAGADLLLRGLDGRVVLRRVRRRVNARLGRVVDRDGRRAPGAASSAVIRSSRATRVVVGLVDALVAGVPVDRVGDQRDRALVVVDARRGRWPAASPARAGAGRRRRAWAGAPSGGPRRSRGSRPVRRSAAAARAAARCAAPRRRLRSAASGSPAVGRPAGHVAGPAQRAVDLGERRGAVHPDERPARPGAPVLRRLEQERAGPVAGELAVHPDRRLVVGEQPAHDRDHPVPDRERAELLARRARPPRAGPRWTWGQRSCAHRRKRGPPRPERLAGPEDDDVRRVGRPGAGWERDRACEVTMNTAPVTAAPSASEVEA